MTALSRVGEIVRTHDPDRFFTALFAPPARREALFTLYAFNHELARAREAAREPMMALIRLQWWREVVEGAARRHEVAEPLRAALDSGALRAADLLAMIEGREAEAEPIGGLEDWRRYVLATAGGVAVAAGRALGAADALEPALRAYGAAYGTSGLLRAAASLARQGRSLLPQGLDGDARAVLAGAGRDWLAQARRAVVPRPALAAVLPAALARADLRQPARAIGARPPLARLAVLAAVARGRV